MPTAETVMTTTETVFTSSPKHFLRKICFQQNFHRIANGNKRKFMDNYLFNQKFTVSKNIMTCCIDFNYLVYYR